MSEINVNEALKTILSLHGDAWTPESIDGGTHPFVVIPNDSKVVTLEHLKFNKHQGSPERIDQKISVNDVESFVAYWTSFADVGSRVFGCRATGVFQAIFDYHVKESPRWLEHQCSLALAKSDEWKIWTASSGKDMNQTQMSEFIEDNSVDIVVPSGAEMLEIASTLQATNTASFESAVKLQTGQTQFKYVENIDGKAGATRETKIPAEFLIRVPVYEGQESVDVIARFRYRIPQGKLTLKYDLLRPGAHERAAFFSVVNQLREKCGSVLAGKA